MPEAIPGAGRQTTDADTTPATFTDLEGLLEERRLVV